MYASLFLAPLGALWLAGCGALSGLDDYELSAAGGGGEGGAGGAFTNRKLPHDQSVIVRYWIDEASEPVDSGTLANAGPEILDLAMSSGADNLSWTTDPATGSDGLRWTTELAGGRASKGLPGPVFDAIDGLTNFTIELVISGLAGSGTNSRYLFHVGTDSYDGLTLVNENLDHYVLRINNAEYTRFGSMFLVAQRHVAHVVVELGTAMPQLYIDGSAIVALPLSGSATDVSLFPDSALVLGNRDMDDRSPTATIHYAALYARAFAQPEADDNAGALLESDDGLLP